MNMKKLFTLIFFCVSLPSIYAQTIDNLGQHTVLNVVVDESMIADNNHQVISNVWSDNWFVLGDAGINTYWADYTKGGLVSRMTPQFNVGVGKWFLPEYGAKFQFTGFRSRADKWCKGNFTDRTNPLLDNAGNTYYKENVKWFNMNVDLMFNITRIIKGYEGIDSDKLMNQFIASVGLGATIPYGFEGSANDFAAHLELQYSHFFSEKKNFSLDVRLRNIFQTTQFDGVCEQFLDQNHSLNVGVTYYFKERGWRQTVSNKTYYLEDNTTINMLKAEIENMKNSPTPVDTIIVNQVIPKMITFPYLVNFVIDRVEVVNRERVNLMVIAEMMKATPDQKYLICGYADKYTGTVRRNIWLAEHRSKNVFKILTEEFGVPASQLVLDDKGGVDNMFYDDPQLSRSAIITRYEEE